MVHLNQNIHGLWLGEGVFFFLQLALFGRGHGFVFKLLETLTTMYYTQKWLWVKWGGYTYAFLFACVLQGFFLFYSYLFQLTRKNPCLHFWRARSVQRSGIDLFLSFFLSFFPIDFRFSSQTLGVVLWNESPGLPREPSQTLPSCSCQWQTAPEMIQRLKHWMAAWTFPLWKALAESQRGKATEGTIEILSKPIDLESPFDHQTEFWIRHTVALYFISTKKSNFY